MLGVGAFLGIGNALGFINYTVIWRYFSWTNQTLAMIVLWAASMYLVSEKRSPPDHCSARYLYERRVRLLTSCWLPSAWAVC